MKRFSKTLALIVLMGFVGCNQASDTAEKGPAQSEGDHGHSHGPGDLDHNDNGHGDHAHSEGGQDHSVEGHAHGAGPHDGTVADWGGGKYHVEFTVDHDKQQATVYVLGSDEKTAAAIDAQSIELSIMDPEMQVILNASPQAGDPAGKASRFVGTHEKLGVVQEYAGTMTGVVDGTPYSGDFEEASHGDHSH